MNLAVQIENFSYTYADGIDALKHVTLSIEHGEKIALIGPNGAGKSSLLLAMNQFIHGSGLLQIDNIPSSKKNIRDIRKRIGLVLQNPDEQLFMPTLFDDVAFGPMNLELSDDQIRERTLHTLKTVGLEGLERRSPHHLSAGQKRAAAIATILSMNPKILTMDEPESSLDPRSQKRLVRLLKERSETIIIATCHMDFAARLCQRAVLIDRGQVIADGSVQEILTNTELMDKHGLEVPGCLNPTDNKL